MIDSLVFGLSIFMAARSLWVGAVGVATTHKTSKEINATLERARTLPPSEALDLLNTLDVRAQYERAMPMAFWPFLLEWCRLLVQITRWTPRQLFPRVWDERSS